MKKREKIDKRKKEVAQLREALRIKNNQLEGVERLLTNRRKEIKSLMLQLEGRKQVTNILQAYILEAVARSESVEIPKKEVAEGLKHGYTVEEKESVIVIRKRQA